MSGCSQLDDPESNLRELNSAPEIMTEVDWRTPGCDITKVGTLRNAENEFFLRRYQTRCGLSFQRIDFWTLVQMTHVMITSQNDTEALTTLPMAQEPSSGSGVKRSNLEAIRRADAEAEKALKRVKVLEERRAAKRASATPMDELEDSATNTEVSADSLKLY